MSCAQYEADVAVVGSGAGGGVAAAVLAEAGLKTLLLEEGRTHGPEHTGTVLDGFLDMYFGAGATITLGRPPISLTMGRTVGGTTAINSSTCFRPPPGKVAAWGGPSYEELEPFFEEVERRIHAHPVDEAILGGNWRVLKRGCDSLGIEIRPLSHNIKDCEGRGRCQFGCPKGAKQSVDRTFVPDAIQAGALLLSEHRVDGVIRREGRAVGVKGKGPDGPFEVRSKTVILAMGAILTPAFLLRHRLANSSRRVGRGLQIHPASRVVAEFDEIVDGHIGLSQGAVIDRWKDHGIMMEGIFIHPGILMTFLPGVGRRYGDLAANYRRLSAFGVFVEDSTTGRVLPGLLGSRFAAFYQLSKQDAAGIRFGIARLSEIYLAAGAKRVFTGCHNQPEIHDRASLERLESGPARPEDLDVSAFHPVGTCPMGPDPKRSVVDFSLQSHDIPDLYVMDASVIPASLGVNPQIAIMSLAMRGARLLAARMRG